MAPRQVSRTFEEASTPRKNYPRIQKHCKLLLNDRADLANHPFFTTSSEVKSHKRNEDRDKSHLRHLTTLTTSTSREASRLAINKDTKARNCPLCVQCHPLYRCGVFKSKPVEERRALVKRKRICFNCINSTEHTASSCKSPKRCKVPGCGRSHHTLLHLSGPSRENADHHTNNTEVTVIPTMPTDLPSDQLMLPRARAQLQLN